MAPNKTLLSLIVVVIILYLAGTTIRVEADSLKEQIENRLKAVLESEMESNEDEEGITDNTAGGGLYNSQSDDNEDTLIQLKAEQKMSFDCYTHNKTEGCESEYCLWKNGTCQISPASYDEICSFYCDHGPCIQPPAGTPPGTPCAVKPRAIAGLCEAIQLETNCEMQHNLCIWSNNSCTDAPSCCFLATRYCATKKKALLQKALKLCGRVVTSKTLCSYAKSTC